MNKELYKLSYSFKKDVQKKILFTFLFIVAVFTTIVFTLSFLLFPVRQTSLSMEPDILKDSCIFFTPLKLSYQRGDVVLISSLNKNNDSVLKKTLNLFSEFFTGKQISLFSSTSRMSDKPLVRRIIGMPGDSIYMRDFVMYIKPKYETHYLTEFELVKNPYNVNIFTLPAYWEKDMCASGSFDTIELGENEFFVLGDSRNTSIDSRLWGSIKKNEIEAKAVLLYFPFKKFRFY